MSRIIDHLARCFQSWLVRPFAPVVRYRSLAPADLSPQFDPTGLLPSPARMEISLGLRRNSDRQAAGWDASFRELPQSYKDCLSECVKRYIEGNSFSDFVSAADFTQRKIDEMPLTVSRVAMKMLLCQVLYGGQSRATAMHLACARGILKDIPHMSGPKAISNAALFVAEVADAYGEADILQAGKAVYSTVRPDFDAALAARKQQRFVCES